jgi:tRNA-dihydrouridine synthase B
LTVQLANLSFSPPILLAPMAGITDRPFRDLVAGFGAGLVVSEMVASAAMVAANPSMRARAELGFDAARTAVQIAGREAHWMAEAARIAEAQGAPIIDINMGCPAKKVTNGYSGSALMRKPDHALRLIEAVVGAVKVQVTLKTRRGWDDGLVIAPQIAARQIASRSAGKAIIRSVKRIRMPPIQPRKNPAVMPTSVPMTSASPLATTPMISEVCAP